MGCGKIRARCLLRFDSKREINIFILDFDIRLCKKNLKSFKISLLIRKIYAWYLK